MAADGNIIRYMITGEEGEVIPRNATHVSVHPSVTEIPLWAFYRHSNIVELICHDGVIKIEKYAFCGCPRLKRVIMKGVEEVEWGAFGRCPALEYVECDKLEIIGRYAFSCCESVTSFNLPSAKIVTYEAFKGCEELKYVKFGKKLESIGRGAFYECDALERITVPLKNGIIQHDNTFQLCGKLKRVDFVEGAVLQETIESLLCDEWTNDMNAEIELINQILPHAYAGEDYDPYLGGKAQVIRNWIANVLRKIGHYKAEHLRALRYCTSILHLALPQDIVMNNVIPFLMLPQHTFDGEIEGEDEDGELVMNSGDENIDESHTSRLDNEEEEDSNEEEEDVDGGREGGDIDEVIQEVVGDGERRKRRKIANDGFNVDDENDE